MSARETEAIFDAFGAFSDRIHREDARRKYVAQLRVKAARECGNCYFWMKSSLCPIDDQRRGYPSSGHWACAKYQPIQSAIDAAAELASPLPQESHTK
jgi:hypothetical protein